VIHAASLLLSLVGFALSLLAMARHQQEWLGRKLPSAHGRALRRSGFLLLALAFIVTSIGPGWAYGAVSWFGWLTMAAAMVVTANANHERFLRKVRQ
jgi:hypothetical protein|tara:strand:+ start:226 stop:516 length:291 start_codon:yes stop_codon:yes gene_type:complete